MLRGFRIDGERDLVFVPLGINYDRVLEDRTLLSAEKKGPARTVWGTLRFLGHNLKLMARSEWHRFGYACVNFGTPVSMRAYGVDFHRLPAQERKLAVARLGGELMHAVGRVVPVVPVALIAQVFLEHGALTELDLKAETRRLLQRLESAHVYIPRRDLDYALTVGLRMLRLRHLVEDRDGLLAPREEEFPLLRYYANSIAHLVPAPDAKIR
jgi:glycerol-3-phosphate O-acyltransferase